MFKRYPKHSLGKKGIRNRLNRLKASYVLCRKRFVAARRCCLNKYVLGSSALNEADSIEGQNSKPV